MFRIRLVAPEVAALRCFLALFFLGAANSLAVPHSTEVQFDTEVDGPVLVLEQRSGTSNWILMLKAYASGSAVLESLWGTELRETSELPDLSTEELEEYLQQIASGALIDYDEDSIRLEKSRLGSHGEGDIGLIDSGAFKVEFAVVVRDLSSGHVARVRKSIQLRSPGRQSAAYPSIAAFRALDSLQRKFQRIVQAKRVSR